MMSCLKCLVSVSHRLLSTADTVTGLVLCQGYVLEKVAQIKQNSHLKQYFLWVRGQTASSCIVYDYNSGYKYL